MNLHSERTIREIRKAYGFHFSKSLGQNFLTDPGIIDKIIEAVDPQPEDLVVEIGPGIGVLTAELAQQAGKVAAIEIDSSLIPILQDTLAAYDNVRIIHQDVLKTDLHQIIAESGMDRSKVIGNLPYYITTPIIMNLLEKQVPAQTIVVMMQKEVAERIQAAPGSKAYGALSVAVQYHCTAQLVAKVPRGSFVPAPKVDSAVLKLTRREARPVELLDETFFFSCVKAGFGQRRKTLNNSLLSAVSLSKEELTAALGDLGIDGNRRAETLTMEEFATVANGLLTACKR